MKYLNKSIDKPAPPLKRAARPAAAATSPIGDLAFAVSIAGGRLALDGRVVDRATEDQIWVMLLAIAHMRSHGAAKRRTPRRRRLAKAREKVRAVA